MGGFKWFTLITMAVSHETVEVIRKQLDVRIRSLKFFPGSHQNVIAVALRPISLSSAGLVGNTYKNPTEIIESSRLAVVKSNFHHAPSKGCLAVHQPRCLQVEGEFSG